MSGEIRSFRDLIVWQKAVKMAKIVYQLSKSFPREEQYRGDGNGF